MKATNSQQFISEMSKYEDSHYREVVPEGKLFRISYEANYGMFKLRSLDQQKIKQIVECFSDSNPNYFFMRQYGYSVPEKISVINDFGMFPTGFLFELLKHIRLVYGSVSGVVEMSNECRKYVSDYLVPLKSLVNEEFQISNVSEDSGRNEILESEGKSPYLFREYQESAIRELIFKGYGRGLIEVGTAGGKSFILANFIYNLQKNVNKDYKFLLLVPNVQLVFQMYGDFEDYGMDMRMVTKLTGKQKKGESFDPSANVIISNRQYAFRTPDSLKGIDVLIYDEAHTALADKTSSFIDHLNPKLRIGCSGSIPRTRYERFMLIGKFGNIVYKKSIGDLQKDGYVSNMKLYAISVTDNVVKNDRNLLFHANSYRRYHPDENGFSEIPFNAAHEAEHEYYDQHYKDLYKPVLEEIAKFDENTLLLFDRIEFGKRLTEMAREIFTGRKVHYIDGSVPTEDRLEITRRMEESGDNVLFAEVSTFSTGINVKRLTNLVFVSSSKALPRILQSIGRTLRLHSSKKEARIFDISFKPFKYSQRHYRERLEIYKEVYNKVPDEKIELEI